MMLNVPNKSSVVLLMVAFLVGVFMVLTQTAYAAEKVGYVELATLFDKYSKTKEADAALSELAGKKQEERDKIVADIRRMKDELVVLSDGGEEKIKKQADIDEKIRVLQGFDETTRKELREIRDSNVKEIFNSITAEVEKYGKKNKYDYIFTERALVYKNEKYDLTKPVLSELNKGSK